MLGMEEAKDHSARRGCGRGGHCRAASQNLLSPSSLPREAKIAAAAAARAAAAPWPPTQIAGTGGCTAARSPSSPKIVCRDAAGARESFAPRSATAAADARCPAAAARCRRAASARLELNQRRNKLRCASRHPRSPPEARRRGSRTSSTSGRRTDLTHRRGRRLVASRDRAPAGAPPAVDQVQPDVGEPPRRHPPASGSVAVGQPETAARRRAAASAILQIWSLLGISNFHSCVHNTRYLEERGDKGQVEIQGEAILEGDHNTAYFHAQANQRRRKKHIVALEGPSGLVEDTEGDVEEIGVYSFTVDDLTPRSCQGPTGHGDDTAGAVCSKPSFLDLARSRLSDPVQISGTRKRAMLDPTVVYKQTTGRPQPNH